MNFWLRPWKQHDAASGDMKSTWRVALRVRWDQAHLPKSVRSPQFSAHVYCGQTAAWINMPLDTEVGLGSDDIVVEGDTACSSQKGGGASIPIFGPCPLWPNGWMDQDVTWHGGGPL